MDASTSWSRRRAIVLGASAAGAALVAGPLGSVAGAASTEPPRPATTAPRATTGLRRDHWTPLIGKRVAVDGPAGRVRMSVAEVEDLRGAAPGAADAFAVELQAPGRAAVAGLCSVTIPGRGVATLLLSPVDRGVRRRSSQIIVNSPIQ